MQPQIGHFGLDIYRNCSTRGLPGVCCCSTWDDFRSRSALAKGTIQRCSALKLCTAAAAAALWPAGIQLVPVLRQQTGRHDHAITTSQQQQQQCPTAAVRTSSGMIASVAGADPARCSSISGMWIPGLSAGCAETAVAHYRAGQGSELKQQRQRREMS